MITRGHSATTRSRNCSLSNVGTAVGRASDANSSVSKRAFKSTVHSRSCFCSSCGKRLVSAHANKEHQSTLAATLLGCAAAAALIVGPVPEALAARAKMPPPSNDPERCALAALDRFADTRANFSQEASSGMDEAFVDVRYCDYSNLDLSSKVFSGVLMRSANFSGSSFVGVEFARVDAKSADLSNTDFTDVNGYSSIFDGANLENAQFENAILTGATFGFDRETKQWANLKGAHFEGALLAKSDVGRMCENPTLEEKTKKYELGCRVAK